MTIAPIRTLLALLLLVLLAACGAPVSSIEPEPLRLVPSAAVVPVRAEQVFTALAGGREVAWRSSGGRIVLAGERATFVAPDEPGTYTVTASTQGGREVEANVTVVAPERSETTRLLVSGGVSRIEGGPEAHLDDRALRFSADVELDAFAVPATTYVRGERPLAPAVRVRVPYHALDLDSASGVIIRVRSQSAASDATIAEVRIATADGAFRTVYLPYDPAGELGDAVMVHAALLRAVDASDGLADPVELFVQVLDLATLTAEVTLSGSVEPQRIEYVRGLYALRKGDVQEAIATCEAASQVETGSWLGPVNAAPGASGRTPLVFIHGWKVLADVREWGGTRRAPLLCDWLPILLELYRTGLDDGFEIYTFGYDSQLGYPLAGEALARELARFERPAVLVGHSNGGLVIRNAVVRGAAFEHAYLLGSPQLGTPALLCSRLSPDGTSCAYAQVHPALWDMKTVARIAVGSLIDAISNFELLVTMYQGTRDLAWHDATLTAVPEECAWHLCVRQGLYRPNPVHDEARTISDEQYQRFTSIVGNLSAGAGGSGRARSINAIFFEPLGFSTDEIVPLESGIVMLDGVPRIADHLQLPGTDHSTVKGGSLADPFANAVRGDGSLDCVSRSEDLERFRACSAIGLLLDLAGRHARSATPTPDPSPSQPPVITNFSAHAANVERGETSTLRWSVSGSGPIELSIDRGVGRVDGRTSVVVSPTETTTYTLTARNAVGSAQRSLTLEVRTASGGGPRAALSTDPAGQARVGYPVVLDARASSFGEGQRQRYEFTSGDGRSESDDWGTWTLSYPRTGTYEPCVRVTNTRGETSPWHCVTLHVTSPAASGPDLVLVGYRQPGFQGPEQPTHIVTKHGEGIRLEVLWTSAGAPLPAGHPTFVLRVLANGTSIADRHYPSTAGYTYPGDDRRFIDLGATLDPGTYTLTLFIDADNDIAETDESNNTATLTLEVESLPPSASFDVSSECLTARFTDTSTHPRGDSAIVRRTWEFRDGNTSALRNPTHTFAADGSYNVRLTVEDAWGNTSRRTRTVSVAPCAEPEPPPVQAPEGGLALSVRDAGGAARSQASVELRDDSNELVASALANSSGVAVFTAVPLGSYTFNVSYDPGHGPPSTREVWGSGSVVIDSASTTASFDRALPYVLGRSITWNPGAGRFDVTLQVRNPGPSVTTASVLLMARRDGATGTTLDATSTASSVAPNGGTLTFTLALTPTAMGTHRFYYRLETGHGASDQNVPWDVSAVAESSAARAYRAVTAGSSSSYALDADDHVYAWGANGDGQLGDGTYQQRLTPTRVLGLDAATSLAAGARHVLAIVDGRVYAWGENDDGELGTTAVCVGRDCSSPVPLEAGSFSQVVDVAAGSGTSLALRADGNVFVWGRNYGSTPNLVSGLTNVTAIAAGQNHLLALRGDGTVWAWGHNGSGELGDGTYLDRSTPVRAAGLTGIEAITAGSDHSLALRSDGSVWAWGNNRDGQIGDGTTITRNQPVQVIGVSNATMIAAGGWHSLARLSNGSVRAWGGNWVGQLGDGTTTNRATPVNLSGVSGAVAISGGGTHSLALLQDHTLRAWGVNGQGQLGDGTTTNRNQPTPVAP